VIIRVGTAHVGAADIGLVHEVIRTRLPGVIATEGCVACHVGRRLDAEGERVLLMTVWRDMASLYQWTGGDLSRLVIWRDLEARLQRVELQLFESLVEYDDWVSLGT